MTDQKRSSQIVNVASVPQRSPFRYPGGKTWLVPHIREWLGSLSFRPALFVEPFLGGGIISLTVGFEKLAESVAMVELDEDVAAVWQTVLGEDVYWLANRILTFDVTPEAVKDELNRPTDSVRQRAFNTILKNRTFHGGILAHGSGLLKQGENGKGIKSRWYPETLAKRILAIGDIQEKFSFTRGDGIQVIQEKSSDAETVFFIDPPYTAGGRGKRAGRRLYNHNELDHERLFDVCAGIQGNFLMTYDNDPEVIAMAKRRGFDLELVPMKNTHHAEMVELVIGKDLAWARRFTGKGAECPDKIDLTQNRVAKPRTMGLWDAKSGLPDWPY